MKTLALLLASIASLSFAHALTPAPEDPQPRVKGVLVAGQTGTARAAMPDVRATIPDVTPAKNQCVSQLRALIGQPMTMTIYTLDSEPAKFQLGLFHGFPVTGETKVRTAANQTTILSSLSRSIAAGKTVPGCFYPHHGLRIVQGGKTVDLVICFSCGAVRVYGWDGISSVPLTKTGMEVFNQVFKACGLTPKE